jgi:hypothetical protein
MLAKFFQRKTEIIRTSEEIKISQIPVSFGQLFQKDQQQKHKQRRQLIIDEFKQPIINFLQDHGIWTPLHIVDFLEVNFPERGDFQTVIMDAIKTSQKIHRDNLAEKPYKKSFYFQPSYILILVKDQDGNTVTSFKNSDRNLEKLSKIFNADIHRLFLVRYFIPPIPEDLYKYDDVLLSPKYQEVVREIVNYIDINYNIDNLTFEKWLQMITSLNDNFDLRLNLPNQKEEVRLNQLLTSDYSEFSYRQLRVKQLMKDTVEKNPISIPYFILILAFLCSDEFNTAIFPYHYLFSPTGNAKERTMNRGETSFPKLFNRLLDESLLPEQFNKCISIIYHEGFRLNQQEIDDLLSKFREKYLSRVC